MSEGRSLSVDVSNLADLLSSLRCLIQALAYLLLRLLVQLVGHILGHDVAAIGLVDISFPEIGLGVDPRRGRVDGGRHDGGCMRVFCLALLVLYY